MNERVLPHPASLEASALLDELLDEYNWPANSKNAARAGWEAANRWLSNRKPVAWDVGGLLMYPLDYEQSRLYGTGRPLYDEAE